MKECFVALGGNLEDTYGVMQRTLLSLAEAPGVAHLKSSRLYLTSPVSEISQPSFLNAVCKFSYSFSMHTLWELLQNLEKQMGRIKNHLKNAPRLIDLDLLFFGDTFYKSPDFIIPHPRWHLRLFVIAPLADLSETIHLPTPINVKEFLRSFTNPFQEEITVVNKRLPFYEEH